MAEKKDNQPGRIGLHGTGGLLGLKPWVTLPDAARRLSIVLDDDVTEADVLRLALDGHLRLSVYFVNHAQARCGKVVGCLEAEWREFPPEFAAMLPFLSKKANGQPVRVMTSINIDDERFLNLSDEVKTLEGVWGLPMIGAERLDIEHRYQGLTGGPAVTLQSLEGAFVEGGDGQICQLQESFDDNEYRAGSRASLERLNQQITERGIEIEEAEAILRQHEEDRKKFLEKQRSEPAKSRYYPAGGLPEDAVLVVRTSALMDFERRCLSAPDDGDMPSITEETEVRRLQRALGALVLGMANDAAKWRNGNKPNVSAFVSAALKGVQNEHGDTPDGYGKTTLGDTINAALKACQSELDR